MNCRGSNIQYNWW